jgi:hypothetical protein
MHLCIIINPPYHPTSIFHLQFHPPFIYLVQKPTHGAPTLHQLHSPTCAPRGQSILHWGTHFCMCTFNRIILYLFGNCINCPFIFTNFKDVGHRHQWNFSLVQRNLCCFWLGHLIFITIFAKLPLSWPKL